MAGIQSLDNSNPTLLEAKRAFLIESGYGYAVVNPTEEEKKRIVEVIESEKRGNARTKLFYENDDPILPRHKFSID